MRARGGGHASFDWNANLERARVCVCGGRATGKFAYAVLTNEVSIKSYNCRPRRAAAGSFSVAAVRTHVMCIRLYVAARWSWQALQWCKVVADGCRRNNNSLATMTDPWFWPSLYRAPLTWLHRVQSRRYTIDGYCTIIIFLRGGWHFRLHRGKAARARPALTLCGKLLLA